MNKLNRNIAPEFQEVDAVNFYLPEIKKLDNSIPCIEYNIGSQELVKVDFVFRAGTKYQTKPLVASMTSSMLKEGTRNFTSLEIANKIDFVGAFLEMDVNSDYATISLYSVNKHLPKVLPVVHEILTQVSFPETEFENKIKIKKQKYNISQEKTETIASIAYSKHIFNGTKYENKTNLQSFDEITREDCIQFFNEFYNFGEMDIFIAGKIEQNVFGLINSIFGSLPTNQAKKTFDFGESNYTPDFQFIEKENAIQSAIRIGKPIITLNHPDFTKLKVANTIFGGYFGSRLMANIREEKGYTYGIGSILSSKENMGSLIIYTEVGSKVTQLALEEIRKEIKLLQTEEVSHEELNKVKNYMLGSLLQNMDGAFDMLERYKALYYYKLPSNYYDTYIQDLKSTNPKEIIKLVNTYFNELSFMVAGSKKVN